MATPLARMRAIEREVVRPAFEEVLASRSLRGRGLLVAIAEAAPSSERARQIYEMVYASNSRVHAIDTIDAPASAIGATLVVEELEGLGRDANPLAGVMLVSVVYELAGDALSARTKTTHFMMHDRALHTMERRFTATRAEDITRAEIISQVIESFTFFATHAMSLTPPFPR